MESGSVKPGGISTAVKSVEGGSTGTNPERCGGVAFELRWLPRPHGLPLVATCGDRLSLTTFVQAGITRLRDRLDQWLSGEAPPVMIAPLRWDLLPTVYDDWPVIDRERQRQIRVHALEQMSAWFVSAERPGDDLPKNCEHRCSLQILEHSTNGCRILTAAGFVVIAGINQSRRAPDIDRKASKWRISLAVSRPRTLKSNVGMACLARKCSNAVMPQH